MIKLKINGQEVEAEQGTTVLEAAERIGIEIPHFCYHPALETVGSCRLCQVEFTAPGRPYLGVSCRTSVAEGMEVETHSEPARKARAGVLEFLLAHHPLDCPICDKAGECPLQDYTYRHGPPTSRFEEDKRKSVKRARLGGHIVFDAERCVLCTRCTRFMADYAHAPQLMVAGRGDKSIIDIFPGRELDSQYTGNLADICPVGALTLEEFRFKVRAWFLKPVSSICPYCSRGCNIHMDIRDTQNRLFRVRPRTNHDVNGYFICNEGRFRPLEAVAVKERILSFKMNGQECRQEAAFQEAARRIKEVHGKILVVGSARRTVEELYLISKIFGPMENARLVAAAPDQSEPDNILRTGEHAPNLAALKIFNYEILSLEALAEQLNDSSVEALVLLDASINLDPHLKEALQFLLVMDYVDAGAAELADVVFPGRAWFEKEGTFINIDKRVQRIRPGLKPAAKDLPPDIHTLAGLGREMLGEELPAAAADVFKLLAQENETFRGLDYPRIGEQGAPLAEKGGA